MGTDEGRDCVAIILAAGVGRRLENHAGNKVLLDFGGQTLLWRTMAALYDHGVRRLSITIGYEAETLRQTALQTAAAAGLTELEVDFVTNPEYRHGSLLSLHAQREILTGGGPVLVMDGDVLYDPDLLGRLLSSGAEGVLLIDQEIEPGDEPVKICFDGQGRIVDFRKRPVHPHQRFGESVGFFRFSAAAARDLFESCARYVQNGLKDTEYEEAIRDLILSAPHRFEAVDVSDLAWTEIDFPEDVVRARTVILPQLEPAATSLNGLHP